MNCIWCKHRRVTEEKSVKCDKGKRRMIDSYSKHFTADSDVGCSKFQANSGWSLFKKLDSKFSKLESIIKKK